MLKALWLWLWLWQWQKNKVQIRSYNQEIVKLDHWICLTSLSEKSKVKVCRKNPNLALKCKTTVFILTDWTFFFAHWLMLFISKTIHFYRKVHFLWQTKVCLLNLKPSKFLDKVFFKHTNVKMCRVGQKKASLTLALSTVPSNLQPLRPDFVKHKCTISYHAITF